MVSRTIDVIAFLEALDWTPEVGNAITAVRELMAAAGDMTGIVENQHEIRIPASKLFRLAKANQIAAGRLSLPEPFRIIASDEHTNGRDEETHS